MLVFRAGLGKVATVLKNKIGDWSNLRWFD